MSVATYFLTFSGQWKRKVFSRDAEKKSWPLLITGSPGVFVKQHSKIRENGPDFTKGTGGTGQMGEIDRLQHTGIHGIDGDIWG